MSIDDAVTVASYRHDFLDVYYKLSRTEVCYSMKWLEAQNLDVHATMKSWWVPTKRFRVKPGQTHYDTASLREPYRILAMMISRLYGEPNARDFFEKWVPLMYEVCTKGVIFNWSSIL